MASSLIVFTVVSLQKKGHVFNHAVTVFSQQIENGHVANQIHGFTTDYAKFMAELRRPEGPPSGAPYSYETKGNPWIDFLVFIMASGIAHGRVRTTTTVESLKMAAIQPWFTLYFFDVYDIVMINWHLSNQVIRWPVPRDHIAGSSLCLAEVTCWPLTKCWF